MAAPAELLPLELIDKCIGSQMWVLMKVRVVAWQARIWSIVVPRPRAGGRPAAARVAFSARSARGWERGLTTVFARHAMTIDL